MGFAPMSKRQSMECKHTLCKGKKLVELSIKKVMLTDVWFMKGPIIIGFLETDEKVKCGSYRPLLQQNSLFLLNDPHLFIHSDVIYTVINRLTKAWTAINRLSTIWKSDLTDKMKRSFFQAAVTSILLYGCTTWTLIKRLEKKLDGNYTRMLRAILNKSWQQHPTRHQLYGHLPPITKTIQVRRTRHAGHCWRSRDELIRDVLLWIPTHGRAKAGRPARTYIQQLCEDTGCCPEDLPRAMNNREEWRERVRDIRAASMIWWWWWYTVNEHVIIKMFFFNQESTQILVSRAG